MQQHESVLIVETSQSSLTNKTNNSHQNDGTSTHEQITIPPGSCRLIGRRLSEDETVFLSKDGNRRLEDETTKLIRKHFDERQNQKDSNTSFDVATYERGADIILDDASISRAHAMLFFDGTGAFLVDLASTNGAKLNGQRVASAMLINGDVITLGQSQLIIRL